MSHSPGLSQGHLRAPGTRGGAGRGAGLLVHTQGRCHLAVPPLLETAPQSASPENRRENGKSRVTAGRPSGPSSPCRPIPPVSPACGPEGSPHTSQPHRDPLFRAASDIFCDKPSPFPFISTLASELSPLTLSAPARPSSQGPAALHPRFRVPDITDSGHRLVAGLLTLPRLGLLCPLAWNRNGL